MEERNILMQQRSHHEDKACEIVWIAERRKNTSTIETCLIRLTERIDTKTLKKCIEYNTKETKEAHEKKLFSFFWRKSTKQKKEYK